MNHIQQQQARIDGQQAEIAALRAGMLELTIYLTSDKFSQDKTVQTSDVLLRLEETDTAGVDAGEVEQRASTIRLERKAAIAKVRKHALSVVRSWQQRGDTRSMEEMEDDIDILAGDHFAANYGDSL